MRFRISIEISGNWKFTIDAGNNMVDWMLKEGLEKGWYVIDWNKLKIMDVKRKKSIGKVLISEPYIDIEEVLSVEEL